MRLFRSDEQRYTAIGYAIITLICLVAFPPLGIVALIAGAIMMALVWIDAKTGQWLKKLK